MSTEAPKPKSDNTVLVGMLIGALLGAIGMYVITLSSEVQVSNAALTDCGSISVEYDRDTFFSVFVRSDAIEVDGAPARIVCTQRTADGLRSETLIWSTK